MKKTISRLLSRPNLTIAATATFVFVTILTDQALKGWASSLQAPTDFLFFRFFPYGNAGVVGGYLSGLDPWVIRIFFSVLFGFLALGVALSLYFLNHKKTPILKVGLIVYVSGVFGNVWDRMTTGEVVDYAILQIPGFSGLAFNFADLIVLAGAILIATAIFREADELWFAREKRQGYWVEPAFQKSFAFSLVLMGFAQFFVIALYSFVFLKVYVGAGAVNDGITPDRVIRDYLIGLTVIEIAALALIFAGSVLFSHRLVGPLMAFAQFVERRKRAGISSPLPPFRVRRSDYFREILEGIAERLEND